MTGNCSSALADIETELKDVMARHNEIQDLMFAPNSIQPTLPIAASRDIPADTLEMYANNNYEDVDYIGAVSASGTPWYAENTWSFYAHIVRGIDDKARTQGSTEIQITDASMRTAMMRGNNNITWTSTNTYILNELIYVQDGETLTIEAGTIIKGKTLPAGAPGASLIIAKGGKIMAMGTAQAPIIFTFEGDPLDGSVKATERGKWGGLIMLGKARLNSTPGETVVEGIPTGETRARYGGSEDADNSGVLRYVSIRHGGTDIGTGNEINGLTLSGVGSGTTIDYVEVVANKDDGIEWFGGTVVTRHLIAAYCRDDALDYDEGYRGFNQFVIVHQDPAMGAADRGGEHDGGTRPQTGTPYAIPLFVNLTSVGNASSRAMTLRDNAGGRFYHSLFTGYDKGIDVEYIAPCATEDSWKRVREGQLVFVENVFFGIGDRMNVRDMFTITGS